MSFLSPCVFPLMPAYAAYLSGRAGEPALATASGGTVTTARTASAMMTGIAFVVGFSVVFICEYYLLEGVLAITIFQRNLDLVNRIAGAIIMVLALQTMGVLRFGWLARERRFGKRLSRRRQHGHGDEIDRRNGGCGIDARDYGYRQIIDGILDPFFAGHVPVSRRRPPIGVVPL